MKNLQQRYEEKLKMLERQKQKTKAMEQDLKKLQHRQKENERKARTNRLINLGAAIESITGGPLSPEKEKEILELTKISCAYEIITVIQNILGRELTDRDPNLLLDFLQKQENNGQYFTNAMSK
jgi:hypothetical protein